MRHFSFLPPTATVAAFLPRPGLQLRLPVPPTAPKRPHVHGPAPCHEAPGAFGHPGRLSRVLYWGQRRTVPARSARCRRPDLRIGLPCGLVAASRGFRRPQPPTGAPGAFCGGPRRPRGQAGGPHRVPDRLAADLKRQGPFFRCQPPEGVPTATIPGRSGRCGAHIDLWGADTEANRSRGKHAKIRPLGPGQEHRLKVLK